MKGFANRFVGFLLIAAAVGGLVFSVFGLVSVRRNQTNVTQILTESLELVQATLATTSEGLSITQESLNGAITSLGALQDAINTTNKTLKGTEPMVDAVVTLLGEKIPQTIQSTRTSLNTAEKSAKVIDTFLDALSMLPGANYKPEVPLSEALQQVSTNLNDLPPSLEEMADSLEETGNNLEIIQVDLALIADSVQQVEESVSESETVIQDYQDVVATVQERIDKSMTQLPKLVDNIALGLNIFFIWLAIAQIGLFSQGWELLNRDRENKAPETAPEEDA